MYFVIAQLDETGEWIIVDGPFEDAVMCKVELWDSEKDPNSKYPYSQVEIVYTLSPCREDSGPDY